MDVEPDSDGSHGNPTRLFRFKLTLLPLLALASILLFWPRFVCLLLGLCGSSYEQQTDHPQKKEKQVLPLRLRLLVQPQTNNQKMIEACFFGFGLRGRHTVVFTFGVFSGGSEACESGISCEARKTSGQIE